MAKIKKEITFVYMDSIEKQIYEPISREAAKRGYKVKFTENKFEKCEIGFYCQHINFPQYSKFSVIMLHDIIQQYGNWPDIWNREPWHMYNIGFLPGRVWVDNWSQCSGYFYTRPKQGMFQVGWPKADVLENVNKDKCRKELAERYGLDLNKKTILYAPAWENDNKQDEFVQAMLPLNVNILIKQYPADPKQFPKTAAEIQRMYELHKDNPRVKILDPSLNILFAIAAADILVSEESSTMCEAVMMGIPAISVSDWLIPDVTPSRFPSVEYDFVVKTKKANLRSCVENMLDNYSQYKKEAEEYSMQNFPNIGHSSKLIMDIIDSYIEGKEYALHPLKEKQNEKLSLKKNIIFWFRYYKREIIYHYCEKYTVPKKMLEIYRKIKRMLLKDKAISNI